MQHTATRYTTPSVLQVVWCQSQHHICSKKKSLDPPNSPQNSNSEKLFHSKTSNLVEWTSLISANFSFKFSAFYYTLTLGAFPYTFLFWKEPFKYLGDLWIFATAPRNEHSKMISRDLRIPRFEISEEKFGEWRLFSPSKFDPATGMSKFALQHVATLCNMPQHTAAHRSALQRTASVLKLIWRQINCKTLQNTATHCNTLQNTECAADSMSQIKNVIVYF